MPRKLCRAIDGITSRLLPDAGLLLSNVAVAAMVALISYEVTTRLLFRWSGVSALDIGGFLTGAITFAAGAAAWRSNQHVRIDLPIGSPALQRWWTAVGDLISLALLMVLIFGMIRRLASAVGTGAVSAWTAVKIPLALPLGAIVVGAVVLALHIAVRLLLPIICGRSSEYGPPAPEAGISLEAGGTIGARSSGDQRAG